MNFERLQLGSSWRLGWGLLVARASPKQQNKIHHRYKQLLLLLWKWEFEDYFFLAFNIGTKES